MINSLGYEEWDGDVQNTCVMTMYIQFLRVCEVGWGCTKYMCYDHVYQFLRVCEVGWGCTKYMCYDHVYQFLRVCESGWSDV